MTNKNNTNLKLVYSNTSLENDNDRHSRVQTKQHRYGLNFDRQKLDWTSEISNLKKRKFKDKTDVVVALLEAVIRRMNLENDKDAQEFIQLILETDGELDPLIKHLCR
jgi:hypothetical protein